MVTVLRLGHKEAEKSFATKRHKRHKMSERYKWIERAECIERHNGLELKLYYY